MVHSKIMIVDDVLLHIGSANLNNRSIGLDSECDLAIEAQTADQRRTVRQRATGCSATIAGSPPKTSLLPWRERDRSSRRRLRSAAMVTVCVQWRRVSKPRSPRRSSLSRTRSGRFRRRHFWRTSLASRRRPRRCVDWRKSSALGSGGGIAWLELFLSAVAYPDFIRHWFSTIADVPGASLIVLAVFVLGGLVAFPVLLLIAATAAAFGPWLGFAYAALGALASAIVTYAIGAAIGRDALETVLGPRLDRVRRSIVERGLFAVAAVRLVPVAPFTLVNLVAGASNVRFADYMLGTMIGMAPGMMMMCALGYQIWSILMNPTLANMIFFLVAIGAWLSLSLGAQALILRWRRGGA